MDRSGLRLLACVLALTLAGPALAGCYEWIDEEGVLHLGSQPPSGGGPVVEHREEPAAGPNGGNAPGAADASALEEAQAAFAAGDDVRAYALLRPLAERGVPRAENGLGLIYSRGKAAERDMAQAFYWHMRAAEQGYDKAQFQVGLMYADGVGVAKDSVKGVTWLCKAADQGLAQAQYSLGAMYANGEGVSQDYRRAAEWYRKAAEQGLREAQYALGFMYQSGQGMTQDPQEAARWLELAAAQGEVRALTLLNRMATADAGGAGRSADAAGRSPPAGKAHLEIVVGDDPCLDEGPNAPAASLAKCYVWLEKVIGLLPAAEQGGTVSLPRIAVGPENVAPARLQLQQQVSDLGAAISQRGYPSIAGTYRAQAAPSCRKIQSSWAGMIGEAPSATVIVSQNGFRVAVSQRFELEGKIRSITVRGAVVASAIGFYDPANSDFGFVGEVGENKIVIRPDAEATLKAWPRGAKAPAGADLADCVVVLDAAP